METGGEEIERDEVGSKVSLGLWRGCLVRVWRYRGKEGKEKKKKIINEVRKRRDD
jgi:hypothetical protein